MLLIHSLRGFLLCLCFLPLTGTKAEGFAVVKGRADGQTKGKEMQLMTVVNGGPVRYAATTVAPNGSFAFMFEPGKADIYYLYDGREYYRLYVKGGDEIQLAPTDKGWCHVGNCSEENRLLERWQEMKYGLKDRSKTDAYGNFFPRFDSLRQAAHRWLDEIVAENENFTARFRELVEIDLLNDFIVYLAKNQQSYESEEQQSAYYREMIKRFPARAENLLAQPYGIQLLKKYFAYKNDFVMRNRNYTLDDRLTEIMSPILKAEYILSEVDTTDFECYCDFEQRYFSLMQNQEQRQRLSHYPGRPRSSLKTGERASNFIFPDTSGRFWGITEFRGKFKYIDLWATWCGPCKAEIPYLQSMEEEFKEKGIVFISISIDKNRKKWQTYVREHHLGGTQLWAGDWTNLPEELHVGSIPRFILVDPEGKWIDTDAPRPSDPNFKKLLKNLLKND